MNLAPHSLALLRDLAVLCGVIYAVGLVICRVFRSRSAAADATGGKVQTQTYGSVDILASLLIGLIMLLLSGLIIRPPDAGDQATQLSLVSGVSMLLTQGLMGLCLIGYLKRIRSFKLIDLFGFNRCSLTVALLHALVLTLPVLIIIATAAHHYQDWLKLFWPDIKPQDAITCFTQSEQIVAKILLTFSAVIAAPWLEEMIFRGFLYGVAKRFTNAPIAALTTSLLFAIIHMNVASLLPLFLLALIFCYIYEQSGNLLVTMLMHAFFNLVNLVFLVYFPDQVS
jgi:uncharacterized protein